MKKRYIVLLCIAGLLPVVWIVARLTNAFQVYRLPTTSNYPTFTVGQIVYGSNLVAPQRFDFITYRAETPTMGKQIFTHRLCGIEGDNIEIKNGLLYINGIRADSSLNLAHYYFMNRQEFQRLNETAPTPEDFTNEISKDSILTIVPDKTVESLQLKVVRQITNASQPDPAIQERFGRPWNADNFGPIRVPKHKYFVLGDNRQGAQDSRYIGFIDVSNYQTTLFNH